MTVLRLSLPSRLTYDFPDELSRVIGTLISSSRDVHLDASQVRFSQPFGVVALQAALRLREKRGLPCPVWTAPDELEAREYLREVGFQPSGSPDAGARDVRVFNADLQIARLDRADVTFVERAAQLVRDRVPGTPKSVSHEVRFALNELVSNVFEHSESTIGCLAQTRWYAKERNVRIAIADLGVNIVRHLRRKAEFDAERPDWLLQRALVEEGVSGRLSKKFGGFGLKHLSDLVTASHRVGALRVISGGVAAEVTAAGVSARLLETEVLGTFLELDFRPTMVADERSSDHDDGEFF